MRLRATDTPARPTRRALTARPSFPRRLIGAAAVLAAAALLAVALPVSAQAAGTAEKTVTRGVDLDASFFLNIARSTAASAAGKVDTTTLGIQIAQLGDTTDMNPITVAALTEQLRGTTTTVAAELSVWEQEQAAAAAAAAALAEANTPDGARATARQMALDRYGWGDGQFSCLNSLWQKESSWNYQAANPSGAFGIPQALPGSKMAEAGSDWRTVAATQISWGLDYIDRAYGSPCAAWGHSQAMNWY